MIVRLGFLVLMILVLCALSLIQAQYQVHNLFTKLELAQSTIQQLNIDLAHMQLDQSILNRNSRIKFLAERNLNMIELAKDCIQYFVIEK